MGFDHFGQLVTSEQRTRFENESAESADPKVSTYEYCRQRQKGEKDGRKSGDLLCLRRFRQTRRRIYDEPDDHDRRHEISDIGCRRRPRATTNNLGQVASRHDYMPFGEEIAPTVANRNQVVGYTANDRIRQQFTGYERDGESGLDFAQNRYFAAKHGRFTSVEPLAASASAKNPQTFNRYSYALNSPGWFTDQIAISTERRR
ncbi:MAG: hypothetical protein IPN69_11905 [Acidobacteria bacterium]|nr:hypothetical protein [Acidobacteriota bacterium]